MCQKRSMTALFDHHVGPPHQSRRDGQPKSSGSLKIQVHFITNRLFYGQVGWFFAFEDFAHESRSLSTNSSKIGTHTYQPTISNSLPECVCRWQTICQREFSDTLAINECESSSNDQQTFDLTSRYFNKRTVKIVGR